MKFFALMKTIGLRAPKNFRSNRLWVIWGGKLYVRSWKKISSLSETLPRYVENWRSTALNFVKIDIRSRRTKSNRQSTAILVTELGMFGNMTRRLGNALTLCANLGYNTVVVPKSVIFHHGLFQDGDHKGLPSGRLVFGTRLRPRDNTVERLVVGNLFELIDIDQHSLQKEIDYAWTSLRTIFKGSPPIGKCEEGSLAIHLRGGDVFGPRKPQGYGQPPLAFYELVLNSSTWTSVTIVHQAQENPVLAGLQRLCKDLEITIVTQSGTLIDDLGVLMQAETLVAGRGTFVPAVANLSPNCKRVIYFEDKCNMSPQRSGLELTRVIDLEGKYKEAVLSNNWENSIDQRELMLSYPVSSLRILN